MYELDSKMAYTHIKELKLNVVKLYLILAIARILIWDARGVSATTSAGPSIEVKLRNSERGMVCLCPLGLCDLKRENVES